MNKLTMWFCCLCLLISIHSFGQYGGMGGGGYGGMGGRRMGGGMGQNMPSTPTKASIPNIAGDMAQKETKWLKENLELTKEQAKAVKQLNNEYASQQQDAVKDIIGTGGGRPSPETIKQVKDVMLMFNEEKEEKLKPILTPEQWTLYQSKKGDMQKEIGGWRPLAPKTDSLTKAVN
ncbi:hypothetical protein [Spirosoma pollinicola]|uniref:Periplasmic heavy metal sensor n=1 Tax=Spirosoma pollinicola TaxID=2057025 RepID=A0A2K8YTF9_9BACT|nr:hypothetical protein [Spirosoma pollinicola]AUD00911.1 hypothetical protein CWM47_03220 [Spirosoma pollinicola]